MFSQDYETRLQSWRAFRDLLETSTTPIEDAIDFYRKAPIVSIHTDPWTPSMWPDPWELINENQYDEFCILLGICYSLQLSTRFSELDYEIHIGINRQKSLTQYFLKAGEYIISHDEFYGEQFPIGFESQQIHSMNKHY